MAVRSAYFFELLTDARSKIPFECGSDPLDRFFRERATRDLQKHVSVPYILIERSSGAVVGFYTLSGLSVARDDFPEDVLRTLKLPKYPGYGVTLIGRMAVDRKFQGRGFGGVILIDALRRSFLNARTVASVAVVVDAKDGRARDFCPHYGFTLFPEHPLRLFIPMKTIGQLLSEKGLLAPATSR